MPKLIIVQPSGIARLGNLAEHNLDLLTTLLEYLIVLLEYFNLSGKAQKIFGRSWTLPEPGYATGTAINAE